MPLYLLINLIFNAVVVDIANILFLAINLYSYQKFLPLAAVFNALILTSFGFIMFVLKFRDRRSMWQF